MDYSKYSFVFGGLCKVMLKGLLKVFWLTLKTVRNPWNVALLYLGSKSKLVKFRGGFDEIVDRRQFNRFGGLLLQGWGISKLLDGKYMFRRGELRFVITPSKCGVLSEDFVSMYKIFDYQGKVVLDIGGFAGETACFFKSWGARKVIIYEPVPENCELIRMNVALNEVDAEIHCVGVADYNGREKVFCWDYGATTYGSEASRRIIPVVCVSKVLEQGIDIAKIDCGGCEYYLLTVPCKVLRKVPMYVIEYHLGGPKLIGKFKACGFNVERVMQFNENVGILKAWL